MSSRIETSEVHVGVVGLGLMGCSVVTALLISGHPVKAIAPLPADMAGARDRIHEQLIHCEKARLLSAPVPSYLSQLVVSEDYTLLATCKVVLECVIEEIRVKESVYRKITDQVSSRAIVASNTSAIPISMLQQNIVHPERFLGVHWAEPAYMTRFLEITCGERTSLDHTAWIFELAHQWGKEPTVLRKDIRGFVTNRLMYAIYREMFSIIQNGEASIEDVDKAFRYDAGSWMTLMGIFRRIDFMGLRDFQEVYRNVLPGLCNDDGVPEVMREMVKRKLRGTIGSEGLYQYADEEANAWNEAFAVFNQDIYRLAALYPSSRKRQKLQ